jgi:hypothetical protein
MLTVPFAWVKDWEWPSNLASNFRLEVVFQLHSFHWERWTWEICKRAKIYCRISYGGVDCKLTATTNFRANSCK